ncbi:MAG: hypothetical protein LBT84_03445 [Spirochaetia bacterium]|jgi:hypothetical protein|nr:hypothetical protein [Spirochaetia bacterium]
MKRGIFILSFFLEINGFPAFSLDAAAYRRDFAEDCRAAESYVLEIRPLLEKTLDDSFLAAVGIAVVFPELSRYSYIRDVAETGALEFSYIIDGDANFSIGKFQMKPSFAMMIENDADEYCRTRYPELFVRGRDEQGNRWLRIQRLKDMQRQAEYFSVFLRLMDKRFPKLRTNPPRMVQIFAAAYNSGYTQTLDKLEKASRISFFPYGKMGIREQYPYCEIAVEYYLGRFK